MSIIEVTGNPRHDQLVHLIAERGYMNIEELAQLLDVSTQTVRRDIRKLSEQGLITRHHGGAGRVSSVMNTAFEQRELSLTAEKRAIAEAVADYLPERCTVFITIGTTVEAVARALLNRRDLRIITNSLRVAQILYKNQDIEVMVPGGTLRAHNGGIIGPGAVDFIEGFRADYLNRVLYKCPNCNAEGKTEGKGTTLTCHSCGVQYELTETGYLKCLNAEGKFTHIPDWYKWEREQVRASLQDGSYKLETDVDIAMMVDFKAIYKVGTGKLTHDENGFKLTGCDGKLEYNQPALACYGLYADYYWYELGDVICIGNHDALYYCFPKAGVSVAKTRMATEELYKLKKVRPAKVTQ